MAIIKASSAFRLALVAVTAGGVAYQTHRFNQQLDHLERSLDAYDRHKAASRAAVDAIMEGVKRAQDERSRIGVVQLPDNDYKAFQP
jgi:hypothetical protein